MFCQLKRLLWPSEMSQDARRVAPMALFLGLLVSGGLTCLAGEERSHGSSLGPSIVRWFCPENWDISIVSWVLAIKTSDFRGCVEKTRGSVTLSCKDWDLSNRTVNSIDNMGGAVSKTGGFDQETLGDQRTRTRV